MSVETLAPGTYSAVMGKLLVDGSPELDRLGRFLRPLSLDSFALERSLMAAVSLNDAFAR